DRAPPTRHPCRRGRARGRADTCRGAPPPRAEPAWRPRGDPRRSRRARSTSGGERPIQDVRPKGCNPTMRDPVVLALVALAGAILALWLAAALRGWRGSRRAKRRAERAGAGEDRAAVLLARAGFAIVARQAATTWAPLVDGEPQETALRADYLVE